VAESAPSNSGSEQGEVLPVLAEVPEARPLERPQGSALPSPLVAATGGFLAGVTTFVLMRVLRGRRIRRGLPFGKRRPMKVAGTRSFLVDVHLLKR